MVKSMYAEKPLDGFVALQMTFYEPPPASASKKMKERMLSGEIRPTRCDNTNMQKFYEDCLQNIVFLDDRFVYKNIS
jgi:Holliday junction resolvase RusA-like endonuclease